MRVGILGCGQIARFHLNTLKTMDDTEIVGVCDVNKENLEKISEEYNISNTHASLDQLIKKSKPDVPPHLRHRQ